MLKRIRAKKDARLFFRFLNNTALENKIDLSTLKTWLIRHGYIEHVEGDKYLEIKKLDRDKIISEILVGL